MMYAETLAENLIPLVYAKPEIWDQSHKYYQSKGVKFKAWTSIGEQLKVSPHVAKARWTNIRVFFRRELKKTLKIIAETGDPNAYIPRWKYFKPMLFLKDQIIKDETNNSTHIEDSFSLYPQTILEDGEDGGQVKLEVDSSLDSSTHQQDIVNDSMASHFQSPDHNSNKRLRLNSASNSNGHVTNDSLDSSTHQQDMTNQSRPSHFQPPDHSSNNLNGHAIDSLNSSTHHQDMNNQSRMSHFQPPEHSSNNVSGHVSIDFLNSLDSSTHHLDMNNQSRASHFQPPDHSSNKGLRWNSASELNGHVTNGLDYGSIAEVDEDYHFVMSILPSIRRIRQERKVSFKMKVFQLIVDEEKPETVLS